MNKVEKERLVNYRRWLYTAELNETKLIAYNCPKCLEKLQTTEAPEGETWDTFSNCPFCGSLLFKVTQGSTVKTDLILNIGKKEPAEQPKADLADIPPHVLDAMSYMCDGDFTHKVFGIYAGNQLCQLNLALDAERYQNDMMVHTIAILKVKVSDMTKSPMKYIVRAWNKELKKPVWRMGSRKHRKVCARNWASVTVASVEAWHEVIDCQDAADEAVAEEVSNWDA